VVIRPAVVELVVVALPGGGGSKLSVMVVVGAGTTVPQLTPGGQDVRVIMLVTVVVLWLQVLKEDVKPKVLVVDVPPRPGFTDTADDELGLRELVEDSPVVDTKIEGTEVIVVELDGGTIAMLDAWSVVDRVASVVVVELGASNGLGVA
jgi:hypothetical protein